MTEVTHLLVNGCSWTYCAGLDDPATEGWPRLVANNLKLPLVNIALPGSSNGSIYRRTAEYLYKNSRYDNKPLVIIMWSQDWRFEAWYNKFGNFDGVHFPKDSIKDNYQRAFIEHYSEEYIIRRSLLEKISVINLLKAFNVPYILGQYPSSELTTKHKSDVGLSVTSKFNEMCNYVVSDPNLLDEEVHRIVTDMPHTKCGHAGKEAQSYIRRYILLALNRLYQISPVSKPHLSAADFIIGNSEYRYYHDWC